MPAVIPVVIAAGVSTLAGGGFIGALAATAFMVAWSTVTRPHTPKNLADVTRERTQVVRSAAAPRQIVYGECMVSGPLIFAESTGETREYLHLIVALAGHEIESVNGVMLNDAISTDARFGRVPIIDFIQNTAAVTRWRLDIDGETVLDTTMALEDFANEAAYYEELADRINSATDRLSASPVNHVDPGTEDGDIPFPGRGVRLTGFDTRPLGARLWFRHLAPEHVAMSTWNRANAVTVQQARGEVRINAHRGTADQAADADLVDEVDIWTSNHRLRGIAYIYARLHWDEDVWVTGIPNIRALAKGKKIYDPRTETIAWSDNWALCVLDYVRSPFGLNANDDEIDWDSFIAAANASDELVEVEPGVYQKRYTLNGAFTLDESPGQIIDKMLSAGAGELCYTEGKFRLRAGVYTAPDPADPITESDLRGDVVVHPRTDRKNLFNAVRGLYCSADDDWQATDFPPVHNELYEDQDGGERIYRDIELPFTTDVMRAQRIAKIALETSRQAITATLPCKPSAIRVALGKTYIVNLPRFGWEEKEFRVVGWTLNPDLSVDLVIREEAAESYEWNYGEATTKDPAPDTNLPDPREVPPPRNVSVEGGDEHALVLADGSIMPRLYITWEPPPGAFISRYEVRYARIRTVEGDPVQDPYTWLPPTAELSAYAGPVSAGEYYLVEVRSVNSLGARSPWRGVSIETEAVTIRPEDPISLTAVATSTGIRLSWQAPADPTIHEYTLRKGDDGFEDAVEIGTPAAPPFVDPLPITPGDYQYWVASVSRSGVVSENKSTATITINAPGAPTVTASVVGEDIVLTWTQPTSSFPISHYLVNGTRVDGRRYTERVNHSGAKSFNVVAVDVSGNQGSAGTASVTVLSQSAPTAITPAGITYGIRVGLTYTRNEEFEALELWMAETNNRANARKVAETADNVVNITGLPLTATRYFWARIRNKFGGYSDWYPSGATSGVSGSTSTDPTDYLEALAGHISIDELTEDLAEQLAAIPDLQNELEAVQSVLADIQSIPDYDENEPVNEGDIVRHEGALYKAKTDMLTPPVPEPPNDTYWEKIGDYASLGEAVAAHAVTLATHDARITDAEGDIEAQAETIGLIQADLESLEEDLESRATVGYVDEAVAGEGLARASAISSLTATVTDMQRSRGNLIVNPSFELGISPHNIGNLANGGTWSVEDEAEAFHGGKVLQYDSTGQTGTAVIRFNGGTTDRLDHIEAKAGDRFRMSIWYRLKSGAANRARIRMRARSADGTILVANSAASANAVTPTSEWAQDVREWEIPEGYPDTSYLQTDVEILSDSNDGVIQFDMVHLERLDAGAYEAITNTAANVLSAAMAYADTDSAAAMLATSLQAIVGDEEDGLVASVNSVAEAVANVEGVVEASYVLVLNANDRIVGYRLATDAEGNDEFDILSSRFRIVNADSDGNVIVPFVVGNINGTPSVGINGNLIVDGSILARHIQVATLAAVSADLGEVTAGLITGVRMRTASSGERIEMIDSSARSALSYYDAASAEMVRIGRQGSVYMGLALGNPYVVVGDPSFTKTNDRPGLLIAGGPTGLLSMNSWGSAIHAYAGNPDYVGWSYSESSNPEALWEEMPFGAATSYDGAGILGRSFGPYLAGCFDGGNYSGSGLAAKNIPVVLIQSGGGPHIRFANNHSQANPPPIPSSGYGSGGLYYGGGFSLWLCNGPAWSLLSHSNQGFDILGTYAWVMRSGTNTPLTKGQTYAGSSLRAAGFHANGNTQGSTVTLAAPDGTALTGTWRVMGNSPARSGWYSMALAKKVAD